MAAEGDDQFRSKLSPTADILAGTFLLAVTVLSLVGNGVVLGVAARRWAKLKGPELLSVNLALTDLGIAASIYPLAVASAWSHRWLGGHPVCTYYAFAGFFFGTASVGTLTAMAGVRYRGTSTQAHVKRVSKRAMLAVIVAVWAYALLWACLPLVGWGRYGVEPFGVSCTLAWAELRLTAAGTAFLCSMFVLCLLLPALAIGLCYAGIVWKLRRAYRGAERRSQRGPGARHVESRLSKMAVLVTAGFIGCWSPYAMVSLWSLFRAPDSISPLVALLPCLFAKSSSVYNPLIYYLFSRSFRTELHAVAGLCLSAQEPSPSSHSTRVPPLSPQPRNHHRHPDSRRNSREVWSVTRPGHTAMHRAWSQPRDRAARYDGGKDAEGTTGQAGRNDVAVIPLVSFNGGGVASAVSSERLLSADSSHCVLLERAPGEPSAGRDT